MIKYVTIKGVKYKVNIGEVAGDSEDLVDFGS